MSVGPGTANVPDTSLTPQQMEQQIQTAESGPGLGYGIPASDIGRTFELEEYAAYAARSQSNPFAGFTLPKQYAGDFWQLYQLAETFASNTGWRYLLTPTQLLQGLQLGLGVADPLTTFAWMAKVTGVDQTKMPWAATGMSAGQYDAAKGNIDATVFDLTGQSSWEAAGLDPTIRAQALTQNWSATRVQDYILQNPALSSKYGWLQYQMNFQQYQNYKISNAQQLRQRYGHGFTDAQALANLADPLTAARASGGAFGQAAPFVSSSSHVPTGYGSTAR